MNCVCEIHDLSVCNSKTKCGYKAEHVGMNLSITTK